jgi:tetratricopeptide (TPR) repeat protein
MRDADGTAFDRSYSVRVWGPSEAAYRRVLAVDPGNDEAHLHLGFVLSSLRRSAEAQSELEAARDRAVDPYIVCLAHLFLARLRERESDAGGAAQEYERALAAAPFAQSAYMALSLLEERRGNPQRARELIGRFVAIPMRERVDDPWWGYHTSRVPVDDLQWLRTWVRE